MRKPEYWIQSLPSGVLSQEALRWIAEIQADAQAHGWEQGMFKAAEVANIAIDKTASNSILSAIETEQRKGIK